MPHVLVLVGLALACGRSDPVRYDAPLAAPLDGGRADAGAPDAGACPPGFALVNGACVEVAASLDGLRWELPCLIIDPQYPEWICATHPEVTRATTLLGAPGRQYDVRVRVRGVVETRAYSGGVFVAPFVKRGAEANPPPDDAWNIYRLDVSAPAERWYLNAGVSGEYLCHPIDVTFTIRVSAGARVSLYASPVDGRLSQIRNRSDAGTPIVVPGVPPAPMPFDGQFLQLDVVGVSVAAP